jgi:hypothetical protein
MNVVPLFPEPSKPEIRLSGHFKGQWYQRAAPGSRTTYQSKSYRAFRPCEECSHLQHETQGLFHPKRAIKVRRVVKGSECLRFDCLDKKKHDAHIELCREHAQLWRDQDDQDAGHV